MRPPSHRRDLGNAGELAVARRLEAAGYRIVGRNVRVGRLEIDLIAERHGLYAFVEVRTRREGSLVHPAATFDHEKRARIRRAAAAWLEREDVRAKAVRFDAAAVIALPGGAPPRIHYYANAF